MNLSYAVERLYEAGWQPWSEGDTEEEALENIRDAIHEYLAALEDRYPGTEVREVEV